VGTPPEDLEADHRRQAEALDSRVVKQFLREYADETLDKFAASRAFDVVKPLLLAANRNLELSLYSEQTRILSLAFKYVSSEGVGGAYGEFGVWKGRTFIEAWRVNAKYEAERDFVAFDSFEGLPELGERDSGGPFHEREFAHSRAAFDARLRRARIPAVDVTVVQGRFDESLARAEQVPLGPFAVAWIDCDLYESTVPVLDYLTSRIGPGTVLLFDDWYTFRASPEKGEMLACQEWLERNPQIAITPWRPFHFAGQSFIVQRA
jgi:O-methyltransferase